MFNALKSRVRITDQDPSFKVRYIGCIETFTACGKGCSTPLVQRLWDNSKEDHLLERVQIKITTSGLFVKSLDKRKQPIRVFGIDKISFCNVEVSVNDNIFSWICKDADDEPLLCHAVLCSNTAKARSIALVLTRAFQAAYTDWKASRIKSVRETEKHQRVASIAKKQIQVDPAATTQSPGNGVHQGENNVPTHGQAATRPATDVNEENYPEGIPSPDQLKETNVTIGEERF